jgi:drug/metabolite transporter (DMT)-like permease
VTTAPSALDNTRARSVTAGLTILTLVCFAANSLLSRAALGTGRMDPVSFTTLRIAGGALVLGALARFSGERTSGDRRAWASAITLFLYAIAFSVAYVRISASVGALLLFTAVQFTMIGGGLLAGERPKTLEWFGLSLSICGLIVLTITGLTRPDPLGTLLMLAAGIGWGVYSLRGRHGGSAVRANAAAFACALPLVLCLSAAGAFAGVTRIDAVGLALALACGTLTTGLGYVVWYEALRGLTATRAAIVQLSVPPLAAIGGVVLLGEAFSLRLVVASLLILGGIALAVLGRGRTPVR